MSRMTGFVTGITLVAAIVLAGNYRTQPGDEPSSPTASRPAGKAPERDSVTAQSAGLPATELGGSPASKAAPASEHDSETAQQDQAPTTQRDGALRSDVAPTRPSAEDARVTSAMAAPPEAVSDTGETSPSAAAAGTRVMATPDNRSTPTGAEPMPATARDRTVQSAAADAAATSISALTAAAPAVGSSDSPLATGTPATGSQDIPFTAAARDPGSSSYPSTITEPIPGSAAASLTATAAEPGSPASPLTTAAPATDPQADLRWHTFWKPFRSELSARGFSDRLAQLTGLDYRIETTEPGHYKVAFAYEDEADKARKVEAIEAATGLRLQSGRF